MRKCITIGLCCIGIALIALIYVEYTTHAISQYWYMFMEEKKEQHEVQPWIPPTSAPIVQLEPTPAPYILLPMGKFVQHHVVLFLYPVGEKNIRFFVIKEMVSQRTKYRAVADACELCFTHNRGFDYMDSYFICRECGMSYHSQRVGIASGGCNPVPLPIIYQNDRLEIAKETLAKVAKMF